MLQVQARGIKYTSGFIQGRQRGGYIHMLQGESMGPQ
jgi:hypothetical protein